MRWVRALHRSSAAILVVCALTAGGAYAAGAGFPVPLPAKAERILEKDWCHAASYSRAEAVKGVSESARRALHEAEQVARAHADGCRAVPVRRVSEARGAAAGR
jgi:hypothetical protein